MDTPEESSTPQPAVSPETQPSKQSRTGLYIGLALGAVILLIAVALAVVFLTDDSSDDKKSSESTTSTSRNDSTSAPKVYYEFSKAATVSASTIEGETGEASLSDYTGQTPEEDSEVGQIIPTFIANDFEGISHTVAPQGKPYMLVFVAHWCPHCRAEVPKIIQLSDNDELPKDVELIAIATGTNDEKPNYPPSEWLDDEGWPGLKIADTKSFTLASKFGLTGYPYIIYVGADGKISSRTAGEQDEQTIVNHANDISQLSST